MALVVITLACLPANSERVASSVVTTHEQFAWHLFPDAASFEAGGFCLGPQPQSEEESCLPRVQLALRLQWQILQFISALRDTGGGQYRRRHLCALCSLHLPVCFGHFVYRRQSWSAADSELIWLAFLFFLGCCAFVVLRRLGILRLLIGVASLSLRNMLAVFLGTVERLMMGLSWAWDSRAVGPQTPGDLVEQLGALEGGEHPTVPSASVAAPAVSKLIATSAAFVASATRAQRGGKRRLPMEGVEEAVPAEDSRLPSKAYVSSARLPGGERRANADSRVALAKAQEIGLDQAVRSNPQAPASLGAPSPAAHKPQRAADAGASRLAKTVHAPQKPRPAGSALNSLYNKIPVAARQQ
ncbi:hypothetical protein Efla_002663 [Eimeria flavescens]